MITLINYNGKLKGAIEPFLQQLVISLPMLFEVNMPMKIVEPQTRPQVAAKRRKLVRARKTEVYHLYGEGAFGGLVLRAALSLKGREVLFESIQGANMHSSDDFMPERAEEFKKMIKAKRSRPKDELDKHELSSNK